MLMSKPTLVSSVAWNASYSLRNHGEFGAMVPGNPLGNSGRRWKRSTTNTQESCARRADHGRSGPSSSSTQTPLGYSWNCCKTGRLARYSKERSRRQQQPGQCDPMLWRAPDNTHIGRRTPQATSPAHRLEWVQPLAFVTSRAAVADDETSHRWRSDGAHPHWRGADKDRHVPRPMVASPDTCDTKRAPYVVLGAAHVCPDLQFCEGSCKDCSSLRDRPISKCRGGMRQLASIAYSACSAFGQPRSWRCSSQRLAQRALRLS